MVHEMFCMHIGQCGLQVGFALWELLAAEHGINCDGKSNCESIDENGSFNAFFNFSVSEQFVPRGIFIDLEPTVVDQMKTGSFSQLYHPDQLISGAEDAANNFARGFHTVGRIMKNTCENRIRKDFEVSDKIHGIHIYRSLGGGTGSGMAAILFEILLEYAKITKIEIPIHPSPHLSCAVVEPYNSILSEHFCMDDVDISFLIDNEALYDIVTDQLDLKEPTVHSINRLVAQVCSSLTASSRFENELYNDFLVLTNLVPYPRIHFPLVSYAPLGSQSRISKTHNSVSEMTHALFQVSNQLVKCDPVTGKYMSCSLVYRGNISPPEIFGALSEIKSNRFVRFVDWCPTGFKVGIVNRPPQNLPESHLGQTDKNVVMMTNSSSVSCVWHRLAQKFHRLYAKRSFVHWFVAEGLEESEFCESLYNLATLAKDYEEVAMDTEVTEIDSGSPAVGEGGEGGVVSTEPAEGGGEKKKAETGEGQDTEEEGEDDDDDEENENASNVNFVKDFLSNNNKSRDFYQKFESLLKSVLKDHKTSDTVKIKNKGLDDNNKQFQNSPNKFSSLKETEANINSYKDQLSNHDNDYCYLKPSINKNVSNCCDFDTTTTTMKDEALLNVSDVKCSNVTEKALLNNSWESPGHCKTTDFDSHVADEDELTTSFLIEELIRITSLK